MSIFMVNSLKVAGWRHRSKSGSSVDNQPSYVQSFSFHIQSIDPRVRPGAPGVAGPSRRPGHGAVARTALRGAGCEVMA
ncbi:MAG: hypothetical protein IT477_07310 [Rhodanobacteraceae bacterium]|nr:hypothetical protein [Rhodanobacteraceae bacterium]